MTEAGAGGSWVEQEEPRGLLAPGLWPPERGRMSFAQAPAACLAHESETTWGKTK